MSLLFLPSSISARRTIEPGPTIMKALANEWDFAEFAASPFEAVLLRCTCGSYELLRDQVS